MSHALLRLYFWVLNNCEEPMSVMIILILASLGIALVFLGAFLWSIGNGQYDDEQAPAIRILFEEKPSDSLSDNTQP